jgi:hypothetical protein
MRKAAIVAAMLVVAVTGTALATQAHRAQAAVGPDDLVRHVTNPMVPVENGGRTDGRRGRSDCPSRCRNPPSLNPPASFGRCD